MIAVCKLDLDRLRAGDAREWEALSDAYFPQLVAQAERLVGSAHAEDMAQDTLAWLWRSLDTVGPDVPLVSVLANACRRRSIDFLRKMGRVKRGRHRVIQLSVLSASDGEQWQPADPVDGEMEDAEQERDRIANRMASVRRAAIDAADQMRQSGEEIRAQVVEQSFLLCQPVARTAAELGIATPQASAHKHQGMKLIRESLKPASPAVVPVGVIRAQTAATTSGSDRPLAGRVAKVMCGRQNS